MEIEKVEQVLAIHPKALLTKTSLVFAEDITYDEWVEVGRKIEQIEGAVHWWIGDRLNFGERKYGEMYSQELDETKYDYGTLRNDKYVAEKVELSRRRDNLSWSHHYEVASLEPDKQEEYLCKAEKLNWTRFDLRQAVKEHKRGERYKSPELNGKYRIIYADPPWEYEQHGVSTDLNYGDVNRHYPDMSIEELCNLPITNMTEDDAVLFLWVTSPKLNQVWKIIDAWGFEYKTSFVWDKVKHNFGYYNSVRHELLLVCGKGSSTPDIAKLYDSVQSIERTEIHSEKPEEFREIIDTLYPSGRRIELFARKSAPGWEVWGNEQNL